MKPVKSNPESLKTRAYKICEAMADMYARRKGWSMTRKYGVGFFDFEYNMSRLGAKDSKFPQESIRVAYVGQNDKCVVMYRGKQWTAVFGLLKDGSIGGGQYCGKTGVSDLQMLERLYYDVLNEMEEEETA